MYDPGSGNFLSFFARAMEWHVALAALMALGIFFPWAFALVGLGALYTTAYCISCACQANLNVLTATEGSPTFARRLKWRAMIALLHLLEPIARDWGRLKGGLTPWRLVFQSRQREHASAAWQRLQPFKRQAGWHIPGTMALDKYNFLRLLLDELRSRGCAVGWNPTTSDWDLKVRRGVLGNMRLRTVVEHHGGIKRLARFSAEIEPQPVISSSLAVMATLAVIAVLLGFHSATAILLLAIASLWMAAIAEQNRLETAVIKISSEIAASLEAESATRLTMSA